MSDQTAKTTNAAGFNLVCPGDAAPVERVIVWKGTAVDVRCVTRVEIIPAAEMAEEFRATGRGLPFCTDDVAVVRYTNGDVSEALYLEVLSPELNSQLVERFTREIQSGTSPRIDLHRMALDL